MYTTWHLSWKLLSKNFCLYTPTTWLKVKTLTKCDAVTHGNVIILLQVRLSIAERKRRGTAAVRLGHWLKVTLTVSDLAEEKPKWSHWKLWNRVLGFHAQVTYYHTNSKAPRCSCQCSVPLTCCAWEEAVGIRLHSVTEFLPQTSCPLSPALCNRRCRSVRSLWHGQGNLHARLSCSISCRQILDACWQGPSNKTITPFNWLMILNGRGSDVNKVWGSERGQLTNLCAHGWW